MITARGEAIVDESRVYSPDDFLQTLLGTLARFRVRPLVTAIAGLSVALAIDTHELDGCEADLLKALAKIAAVRATANQAIVTLVGEEVRRDPTLASRVFSAVDETHLGIILHGSSPISLSFVVAEREVERVIARLHEVFFSVCDPHVFE
jgi:aspartokinase